MSHSPLPIAAPRTITPGPRTANSSRPRARGGAGSSPRPHGGRPERDSGAVAGTTSALTPGRQASSAGRGSGPPTARPSLLRAPQGRVGHGHELLGLHEALAPRLVVGGGGLRGLDLGERLARGHERLHLVADAGEHVAEG